MGHLARDCRKPKLESQGRDKGRKSPVSTKVVTTERRDPTSYLTSGSDSDHSIVNVVRIRATGSRPRCVKVEVQGISMYGIVDSGADITIMGGEMLKRSAREARLKRRHFQKPDQVPLTYDHRPFAIDGRMDLNICFENKEMKTPVYIKMDAHDQLLLTEGVCNQLGIVSYHAKVEIWRNRQKKSEVKVPSVRVKLIGSVRSLPFQSALVIVQIGNGHMMPDTVLVEPLGEMVKALGVTLDDGLVKLLLSGTAQTVMSNSFGFTMKLEEGAEVGSAVSVDVESITAPVTGGENSSIGRSMKGNDIFIREVMLADEVAHRQHQLDEFVRDDVQLPNEERQLLGDLLKQHHEVFCLSDWERGETNLVEMEIHTGDATPLKVMPFGLTNAPSVFQRLMQCVLMGLNPDNGSDFVGVYIDDVIAFSEMLEKHLQHLDLILK